MGFKKFEIYTAIIAIIAFILIYGSYYLFHPDLTEIVVYIWKHLGLIAVDVLVVVLLVEGLLSKKENEILQEKLDMILSSFYMEVGNELIYKLASINSEDTYSNRLKAIHDWDLKDYDNALKVLKQNPVKFSTDLDENERFVFLNDLRIFLKGNRKFLMDLINNPNLFEKIEFSELLMAISHLSEELEYQKDLQNISENDFNHLVFDMNRVYVSLVYEWIRYLRFNKKNHPYVIDIVLRTNPFNKRIK